MQTSAIEVDHHAALVCMCINNVTINIIMVNGGSGVNVLSKHLHIRLGLPQPGKSDFIVQMAKLVCKPS